MVNTMYLQKKRTKILPLTSESPLDLLESVLSVIHSPCLFRTVLFVVGQPVSSVGFGVLGSRLTRFHSLVHWFCFVLFALLLKRSDPPLSCFVTRNILEFTFFWLNGSLASSCFRLTSSLVLLSGDLGRFKVFWGAEVRVPILVHWPGRWRFSPCLLLLCSWWGSACLLKKKVLLP